MHAYVCVGVGIRVDVHVRSRSVCHPFPTITSLLHDDVTYDVQRTVRGVDCDTWAAERIDYPKAGQNNPSTTWTWYFATVIKPISKHGA